VFEQYSSYIVDASFIWKYGFYEQLPFIYRLKLYVLFINGKYDNALYRFWFVIWRCPLRHVWLNEPSWSDSELRPTRKGCHLVLRNDSTTKLDLRNNSMTPSNVPCMENPLLFTSIRYHKVKPALKDISI
jgi:hypothetical protein